MNAVEDSSRFEVSSIGEAALQAVLEELARVAHNRGEFPEGGYGHFGSNDGAEYTLGDLKYKSYDWGECPRCTDWEEDKGETQPPNDCEHVAPNLEFGGVKFWWYKHSRRGLGCNLDLSPKEWSDWLVRTLDYIQSKDVSL